MYGVWNWSVLLVSVGMCLSGTPRHTALAFVDDAFQLTSIDPALDELVETRCVVAVQHDWPLSQTAYSTDVMPPDGLTLGQQLHRAFGAEPRVHLLDGVPEDLPSPSALPSSLAELNIVTVYPHAPPSRACLLPLPRPPARGHNVSIFHTPTLDALIAIINGHCHTHRSADGSLTHSGRVRQHLLDNLYHPLKPNASPLNDAPATNTNEKANTLHGDVPTPASLVCEKLQMPLDRDTFIQQFLGRSKPVIIQGALDAWPRYSNDDLKHNFGNKTVHIKLAPNGQFEGCDNVSNWKDNGSFRVPAAVRQKLPFPDKVVVRPAHREMEFGEFIDLISSPLSSLEAAGEPGLGTRNEERVSAYLEYTSIKEHFSPLLDEFVQPDFANVLQREHENIWLSDGNTVGKLHFDPYDNLLCQLSGHKNVTLFDPHDNTRLYEGHIAEAELEFEDGKFVRKKLVDATAMVMSPVDIQHPDHTRFPRFRRATPVLCNLEPGDILYMPAFWWHEVVSSPDRVERRNLAVNFWYTPFFNKEFPCAECSLDVNPHYFELLSAWENTEV
eukprot:m.33649 g.33649  ORF g.33649 m.33649 type:complete len:556 (+) comp10471_c0_seq2:56-1723(+)